MASHSDKTDLSSQSGIDLNFGPKQRTLLEEITHIIREYPDGSNILKELVQNADDAEAGSVAFLLDSTQHPQTNLCIPKFSRYQGPALYTWNDAIFKQKDWEGIQKIGRSIKEKTALKVGRFGLGFVSVYHLTDCPTILSDQQLGINHPLMGLTTPGQTGVGLSLSSLASDPELTGHLSCFKGYFGYEGQKEYNETIIRFPLRNVKSEIADGTYDVTSVRQKLIDPLMLEAEQALLFLKNVFSIEIYERVQGRDVSLFRTEIPSAHRDNVRLFRADMVRFASSEEYKVRTKVFVCLFPTMSHGSCVGETRTVWLLLNVIGFGANNADLRQFYCDQQPDYLPWVGIALATGVRDLSRCGRWEFEWNEDDPSQVFNAISTTFKSPFIVDTDTELDIASGKIYCFLPTQLHSKFPFHFHGYFSLSSNRRAIPWPSHDNESEIGARWNFLLCESLGSISYALFFFISTKALKHPSPILYHYQLLSRWSALEPCNTPFNSILCGGLQRLSDGFLLLYTQQQGGRWIPVGEGIFLPSLTGQCIIHESICLELMEALDQPIINIPESFHEVILSIPPVKQQIIQKTLTPNIIRELLIMHSSSIDLKKFLSSREKSIPLLEVILTLCSDNVPPERIREILLGVPLLPIVSNNEPQIFSTGHNSVYISTNTAALLSIFPGLEESFVDPSIPIKLHSNLLSIASRVTSLSLCDLSNLRDIPHMFSQLMSQSLSSHFTVKQNTPVKWTPSKQTHPPSNWISSVFQFIGNSKSLLTAVAPLPLLPQNIITEEVITLLPIQSDGIYIERSEDDNLAPLENLLGMSGCTLCVRQQFIVRFDELVLRPIPKGLIPALESQKVLNSFALALERSHIVTNEQKFYLIELLIPIIITQNSRIISQLPLFLNTNGQWMRIRSDTILPPLAIPHGIKYPAHFISPFNSSVTKLYEKLGLPSLSNDKFLQIHLMPYLQSQQDPDTRNLLMLFILENLKLFDSTYLKNTGWILDSSTDSNQIGNNKLYPPSKLIDPRDHILIQLISNHPRGVFANSMLEDYFDIMKKHLDLRSHSNLSFELCHSVCVSAVDNLQLKLGNDWTSTFHVLLNLLAIYSDRFNVDSWHTLLGIFKARFVVSNSSPPLEWPDSIRYKTTTQLCLPQEILVCTRPEDAYLVGCVRNTLFLSRELLDSSLLREMGFLTHVSTQLALEQLNFLTRQKIKHSNPLIIQRMVSHIYSYLDKNIDQITNPAIDIFIPDELSFVSADRVVFSAPFDLKPYIYSLQDLHYNSDGLFRFIKVNESPSLKQLLNTLTNVYKTCPTLTSTQLDLVINILNVMVSLERQIVGDSVYIPGKDLKLYKPNEEKLVFCDQSWLNRSAIEEDFIFVHDKISNDTAYKLGVSPFSERVAAPGEFWFEETGQQIAVTDRIRGILDGYHGTINVLKEMLQNADDAKATELNVVFDWRIHPKSSLLSPAMGAWQGPAILFYNNSTFRDVDFNNVMKIEGATKARDTTSIGQFGLGFCTVYHLTDVPSFVSRNYIHILDPHRHYLKRGAKIDFCKGRLAKYIQLYQDQFAPYQGLFGCDIFSHSSFNGTLFRLPIRTCDVTSRISLTAYDKEAIIRIQEDFIQEAESLLFFMQYIDSLGIYSISPNSTCEDIELIHSVKRSTIHRGPSSVQPFLHSNSQLMENMLQGLSATPVYSICEYSLSVTDRYSSNWIVAFATGSGPCVSVLKKFPRPTAPLPFAGVALNLDLLDQGVTTGYLSNLYCFLPLPIQIQLPFHCHAMFELRHDRQGLVNTAEAKTEWNKVIVSDALVRAVFTLYKELASRVHSMGEEDILQTYTCLLFGVFPTGMIDDPLWSGFAAGIAKEIYKNKFSFFLVKSRKGMQWCNFKSATFVNNPEIQYIVRDYCPQKFLDSVSDVLVECGYQVAMIPEICFENGGFLSFLLKSNKENIFDFKKFSTLFFDRFTKFQFSKIVEVLRVLISVSCHDTYTWLHDLIKKCTCIPCGESGKLKFPHTVIDPNATLVVGLYEASENRHPTELCCEALFNRESQSLYCLINNFHVISVPISVDELKSRASYIHKHKNEDIALRFIEYLDQKIFTKSEVEVIYSALKNQPFIPVANLSIQGGTVLDKVSFHSPTLLIPHNSKELVELQLPVVPDSLVHYKGFISKMKIGITDYNLPKTLQHTAIDELSLCILHYSTLVQAISLYSKVKKIYEYLGYHFQSLQTKINQLPDSKVLIPLVGFCPISVLLLSSDEDFSPYLYSIKDHYDMNNKNIYDFFYNLRVPKTLSISQCNQTLKQLSEQSQKSPLNSNQQRIAIRLTKEISENSAPKREDNYFMLCLDNCVHLAHDCVFHDLSWDKRDYSGGVFTHKEKHYYFIHKHVSNEMAFCMGVNPLTEIKLSGRKAISFSYKSHGQSEPLTTRLKNILFEYESDVDVFKELTQNADDAKASEIKFLFDYSTHGVESLVHDEMRHWQGPAIYCYNNATFSDDDFKNITRLASRSKITDHSTIGTFGTGFNAVYRLTDLPSFVSRRLITLFDPHVSYLKKLIEHDNPGMQIDFVNECDAIKDFSDQFSVYNGIFGCDLFSKIEYKGTLFRLPLRTSKVTSKISPKSFDSHTPIQHLQEQLLNIAHDLILFLKNIQCIEIYTRRSPDQNMSLEYKMEKSLPNKFQSDYKLHLDKLQKNATHDPVTDVKTIELTTLSSSHAEPSSEEIIISYASGTVSSFSLIPELKQDCEISAIPFCAVALPKRFITLSSEEFSNVKCTLFSFLPIPCASPYPLHINGSFQLQQSRRAFFSTADRSIRTRWNQTLINDALTIAVVNMLISLTDVFSNHSHDSSKLTTAQLERYCSFLPDNITKENILWGTLASSVATHIIASNAAVFYCSLHPQRWISYEEISFFLPPTQYALDTEFISEVVFPYSAQFGIYFMDLIPNFIEHDVFKKLVETKGFCYNISKVCEEIFVRMFNEFEIDFQHFNTIHRILSTLLNILKYEPNIKELLTHTPCIPCGENDSRLLAIPQVLSPNSIFRQIFYSIDKRLPHTLFHHLFDKEKSPETHHTLNMLGVITNTLPLALLVDRCSITSELSRIDKKQALQHSQCLLDYLNSLRLDGAQTDEIKNMLFDIHFIPVYQDDLFQMISPESRCAFSPPSKCCEYDSRHLSLDCHAITKEANSLCHALTLLGISGTDIPLESIINTLLVFQENERLFTDQAIVESEITKRCKAIYLHLAKKCSQSNRIAEQNLQVVQERLDGKAWLWHPSLKKFYSINQLVSSTAYMNYRSSFLISFPYTDFLEKGTTIAEFFKNMKLAKSVTSDMAIVIISLMKQHFGNDPLPFKEDSSAPNECGLVIRLINEVIKVDEHTKLDEMYLLTENNTLQLSRSLFNNDVPWMEFSEEEKRTLVNHRITLSASHNLGARSKMDTFYDQEWEDFGQYEDISTRITNLLREFPCDVTIFKELIQNADDSQATEVAFILDCQKYKQESLCPSGCKPGWKELQTTPSLLVYNNRSFTAEDLRGIQAVGIGGKEGKNTIGRFGLGFNSVFHLTRCPCLLTTSEDGKETVFCVFDPHQKHLEIPNGKKPGTKMTFSTNEPNKRDISCFEDQFAPYFAKPILTKYDSVMENLRKKKCFSIFRLPLNTLIDNKRDVKENLKIIRELLEQLIKEAPRLLPFIKNVKQIQLFEIGFDSDATRVFLNGTIKANTLTNERVEIERPIAGYSKSLQIICREVSIENLAAGRSVKSSVKWLIYHFEGNVDIFYGRSELLKRYEHKYDIEKLRLFSSIAVEIVSENEPTPTQKRYLYCHLPFGTSLNFPVHVNAPFILDPHRRYVSYQDETSGFTSWDNVWHREIMKLVLAPIYSKLLCHLGPGNTTPCVLSQKCYFDWYYSLFPVIHKTEAGSNSTEYLQSLGREVLTRLYEVNSPILLADDIDKKHGRTWYQIRGPNAGVFKIKVNDNYVEIMGLVYQCVVDMEYPLTLAPISLAESFQACSTDECVMQCKFINPRDVSQYINNNPGKLCRENREFPCSLDNCIFTFNQLNILLDYVLTHFEKDPNAKDHIPCLPLKVDFANNLGTFRHSHITFTNEYANLLPQNPEQFLSKEYHKDIIKRLTDCGYVGKLNVEFLSANLVNTHQPSNKFFLLFWQFIKDSVTDLKVLFRFFGNFNLVPITYGRERPVEPTFRPIDQLIDSATNDLDNELLQILYKFGCPFLYFDPYLVCEENQGINNLAEIHNFLKTLAMGSLSGDSIIGCVSNAKKIDVALDENEAERLRSIFQNISYSHVSHMNWQTLTRIKMFVAECEHETFHRVALNEYSCCFMNDDKFPLSTNLIIKLREVFKLVFISPRSWHNNPTKLIQQICKRTGKDFLVLNEFIESCVLHTEILPRLEFESQKAIILFIFGYSGDKDSWTSLLKSLPFINIPENSPYYFKPAQLYCPHVPLFSVFKKNQVLPQHWAKVNELYTIIVKLGLNKKIELRDIVDSANYVATNGINCLDYDCLKLPILALINFIDTYIYAEDSRGVNSALQQLSTVKFLPMSVRHSFRTTIDNPTVSLRLGSFSEAQLYKHHDYCCMSCPIFDSDVSFGSDRSEEYKPRFNNLMTLFGLRLDPQIDDVRSHLRKLIECCNTHNQQETNRHLKNLFFKTYEFLQNNTGPLPDFENGNCILFKSNLFQPKSIVFKWTHDLSPYLFECPHELEPFKEFLLKLKVAESPNYKHFKFVLNCIRRDNVSSQLHEGNLCLQAQKAFSYLISELHSFPEHQQIDLIGMLLLTDKNELIPYNSQLLFYADDTQLFNRMFAVASEFKILAPLDPNQLGSFAPPQCLQIKLLSDRFRQSVSPAVYENFRREDILSQTLKERLVSPEVYLALKRIYFHDTHQDMDKVRIRSKKVILLTEGEHIEAGYLSIREKIAKLKIEAVNRIDITITDLRTAVPLILEDACICFVDEAKDTILINVREESRQCLPVEMTYELNQYFANLFDRSLIHLLICHVYTGEDIGRTLNNFKIRQLPPGLAHH